MLVAPLVALAILELLARVDERRWSIVVALTLAVMATVPRFFGAPFDSLVVGDALLALLCAVPAIFGARRVLHGPVLHERPDPAFAVVCVVVFVLGAVIEIDARLWDGDFGHFGFSSSIARGVLPPEHPLFPGEPLRYHVGFDVLVAQLIVLGVPIGAAVHALSLTLLAVLLWVARDVARALGASAALVAALSLLGYAPTATCLAGAWAAHPPLDACSAWFPASWVSAQTMPPTVFSSFFQHPQGLAMPIALALMLLALPASASGPHARASMAMPRTALCAAGLVLLAHCQIAYFACAGLGIGVALTLSRPLHALPLLLAAAVALATSDIAGGAGELRFGRGYYDDSVPVLAGRYLAIFGPSLLAPIVALRFVRAPPLPHPARPSVLLVRALVVASLSGFLVASVVTYARSWDIVKFFAIGAFFGNVLLAVLLSRPSLPSLLRAVLVALSVVSATFWAVRSGVLNGVIAPRYALPAASSLGQELLRVAGDDIAPRDVILTPRIDIWHQGFHVVGADHRKFAKGQLIDTARAEADQRRARAALRTLDAEALDALSVDWLLLPSPTSPASPTSPTSPTSRALEDRRRFVEHARVLDHVLYRVVRP